MKTMITVVGYEHVLQEHLDACIAHAKRFENAYDVRIHVNPRDSSGFLEYLLVYEFPDGHKLTVGAIQRKPGDPVEFHS